MPEERTLFKRYKDDLTEVTNCLSLKEALKSDRGGAKGFRDYFVFLKMALQESMSYFAIVQTVLLFTALTPQAIENINSFLKNLGVSYQFPIGISSVATFSFVLFLVVFGIVAFRFFGLARRANEVGSLYSPSSFLLYNKLLEIERKLEELKKK